MPIASTRPNRLKTLIENPNTYRPRNAPVNATGTTSVGISVARRFCRNSSITKNTSTIASPSVFTTSLIDTLTKV